MTGRMTLDSLNIQVAYAECFVLAAVCVVLLVDLFVSDKQRWITATLTFATLAGAAAITTFVSGVDGRVIALGDMFVADPMGDVLKLFLYLIVGVALLYSRDYLAERGLFRGEYYVLSLFAMLGIMVIISANSLLTVYLGIELLALALYALVAFDRDSGVVGRSGDEVLRARRDRLGHAALRHLDPLRRDRHIRSSTTWPSRSATATRSNIGLLFGLAFIIVGIAFKFGAVPFHMWLPDVYHGAPTAVTLFLGSAPKIAYFALAMRVLAEGLGGASAAWIGHAHGAGSADARPR